MTKRDPFDLEKNLEARDELDNRRKQVREQTKLLLEKVMSDEDGRWLVYNILELTQLNACSFNTNALAMSFNEGRRSIGLDVQGLMKSDSYLLMVKEAHERRKQSKRA